MILVRAGPVNVTCRRWDKVAGLAVGPLRSPPSTWAAPSSLKFLTELLLSRSTDPTS